MTGADRSYNNASQGAWVPRFTRLDWLLLLAVFAIAVFFRLWQKGRSPRASISMKHTNRWRRTVC